jgi:hypothetical protein
VELETRVNWKLKLHYNLIYYSTGPCVLQVLTLFWGAPHRPKASTLSDPHMPLTHLLLVSMLWHRPWGCEVDVATLNLFRGVLCEVSKVPACAV